jgi:ABC-type uncharacterized transport system substrate-binding protein
VANRPIVIDIEPSIGYGGTGAFLASAHLIGVDAAQLALRILDGEDASSIPLPAKVVTPPARSRQKLIG